MSGPRNTNAGTAGLRDIDEDWCPQLVKIHPNIFLMGSAENEKGRHPSEGPQHWVKILNPFYVGKFPITFGEYDHFCHNNEVELVNDSGFRRDQKPIINVNYYDAKDYTRWLSEKTGKPYRLLTEAEWEYCCRAGTDTLCEYGVVYNRSNYPYNSTKNVGFGAPNSWGLYDMQGNVWEWVEDLWHDSFLHAPIYGSAWVERPDVGYKVIACLRRALKGYGVLRGGSWRDTWEAHRPAARDKLPRWVKSNNIGFRIARDD